MDESISLLLLAVSSSLITVGLVSVFIYYCASWCNKYCHKTLSDTVDLVSTVRQDIKEHKAENKFTAPDILGDSSEKQHLLSIEAVVHQESDPSKQFLNMSVPSKIQPSEDQLDSIGLPDVKPEEVEGTNLMDKGGSPVSSLTQFYEKRIQSLQSADKVPVLEKIHGKTDVRPISTRMMTLKEFYEGRMKTGEIGTGGEGSTFYPKEKDGGGIDVHANYSDGPQQNAASLQETDM